MTDFTKKMEELLFDYGTTYRTDYRDGEIITYPKTVYKEKRKIEKKRSASVKDIHTLTDFIEPVPFSLLHKPKEIVRTNPWVTPIPCSKLPDPGRLDAQRTRPRLVMTPALSLDDIEDPHARQLLIEDLYISDAKRGQREAVAKTFNVRAPLPDHPARAKPIYLPKLHPPVVPHEWRKDTLTWDGRQIRGECDPTRDFWLLRDCSKCLACQASAVAQEQRKQKWRMKGQRC